MSIFKRKKKASSEPPPSPPRDERGVERAAEQLAISQKLLNETKVRVIQPLEEMHRRNNVTGIVRKLVQKEPE